MYPRKLILQGKAHTHVFFRCHNRQFFLKPKEVKEFLIRLWAKNHSRYNIKIFEFNIMDNHAHLILQTNNSEDLGNFMRTVNSQLARYINYVHQRDSQALRERYKSPIISTPSYLVGCMAYVWLNRYKVNKHRPEYDIYCSASWRINSKVADSFTKNTGGEVNFSTLLSPYEDLPLPKIRNTESFVRKTISDAISRLGNEGKTNFINSHTIGDSDAVEFRGEMLSAFGRGGGP
jgi:REP element-mobilizing transposase RayT